MSNSTNQTDKALPLPWYRRRWSAFLVGVAAGHAFFAWLVHTDRPIRPAHELIVVETFDEDRARGFLGRSIDVEYMRSKFVGDDLVEWHPHATNKSEVAIMARFSTGPHTVRFDATEIVKLNPKSRVCRIHIHVGARSVEVSQCLPVANNPN
jgi:hypothetical protein